MGATSSIIIGTSCKLAPAGDEVYKPLLKFSFTEFNFIYNITYTIDSKGVLTEASALVYEFIKNNFEIITQFKLNKVDL